MRYLPFSFKQIPIVAQYGTEKSNTSEYIFELGHNGSNDFILCHIPQEDTVVEFLNTRDLNVANAKGVIRNNCIHSKLPNPELTKADYENIVNDIHKAGIAVNKNTYVVYAVNLESGKLGYEAIFANDIKDARRKAKEFLSILLRTKITISNLMLDPVKNSDITYTYNLNNSYIGNCIFYKNRYRSRQQFMVGVFKPSLDINKVKQNYDWLDTCR